MAKLTLQHSEAALPTELQFRPGADGADHFEARIGERIVKAQISAAGEGEGRLTLDGRVVQFFFARDGKAIELWIEGRTYRFHAAAGRRRLASQPGKLAVSGDIKAPMPGTILKVNVAPGAVVAANEPLIVMVSMKMEMTLAAPRAGRVASVACATGQMVEMHAVLAVLEPMADAEAS